MDNNVNVLDEINKGATMGMDAIMFVYDKVGDQTFKKVLDGEYKKYKDISQRVGQEYENFSIKAPHTTNAMNKGSTNTEEVISKPNKMAEPAQSTAESALPEPVLQGRKVNMDDAMWEDAINELDEYIDQQIGGN